MCIFIYLAQITRAGDYACCPCPALVTDLCDMLLIMCSLANKTLRTGFFPPISFVLSFEPG